MSDVTTQTVADEEGVLARAGWPMATAIGAVACAAMAEAGWNLGRFVLDILHLPFPLAVMFPLILEAVAGTFAVQDLRDRRQGHHNKGMRAATYATLVVSSGINGFVGMATYGRAGVLEVLPPLVLAAVIHLHGDRATRAWHSRAVLRPEWRAGRDREARVDSVLAVLPLLLGDDEHGRATVSLLRRRLESGTLGPGQALVAAGWGERATRIKSGSALRRLECIADTVWGVGERPAEEAGVVATAPKAPRTTTVKPQVAAVNSGGLREATDDDEIRAVLRKTGWPGRPTAMKLLREAGYTCDTNRLTRIIREGREEQESAPRLHAVTP